MLIEDLILFSIDLSKSSPLTREVKLTALEFLQTMFGKMRGVEGTEDKEEEVQYWTPIGYGRGDGIISF